MQEKILDEMGFMIKNLENGCKNDVQPNIVDIGDHFDICIASIINNLLFGYRFDEVSHKNEYAAGGSEIISIGEIL